jgi:release factor glutamine methyltransferase
MADVANPTDRAALVERFSVAGFVAPEEEADDLMAHAAGDPDFLEAIVARRLTGEPLAWITGQVQFCGVAVQVDAGVYVPRPQSQELARRAMALLPAEGAAIDLCTGTGAIAKVLSTAHPRARVVASDADRRAVACARSNGVEAFEGDLFAPLPVELHAIVDGGIDGGIDDGVDDGVDVIVAVAPYVPTPALDLLQRDTLAFESPLSYDGGPDGTDILRRVLRESPRFLRHGGVVLLELGGDQAELLQDDLARFGYGEVITLIDDEGDVRGIEAKISGDSSGGGGGGDTTATSNSNR